MPVVDLRDFSLGPRSGERGRGLGLARDDVDGGAGLCRRVADSARRPVGAPPSPVGDKDSRLGRGGPA